MNSAASEAERAGEVQVEDFLKPPSPESSTQTTKSFADSGTWIQFESVETRRELSECGLIDYGSFVRPDRGTLVQGSSQTTNRRVSIRVRGASDHAYLKVYDYEKRPWYDRFRRAKPLIEARNYQFLRRIGIAVPDVLAFGCRRRLGRLVDGFILTREIPDSVTLQAYFEECGQSREALSFRHILVDLADLVSRMHAANFYHVDLQWRNILVSPSKADNVTLYILDCVRGGPRIHPLMRRHGMLRDLAGLHKDARRFLSATQQLRWLRYYFAVARLTETHHTIVRSILRDREIKSPERSG